MTRGHAAAVRAISSMLTAGPPHAVVLTGPPAVGKTTLALDLAAGLLCLAPSAADRPCRECRGCRLVAAGNHPDLHRIAPAGPGGQIPIAGIRELVSALALLPVEGGARVAIIEAAHRMNEDAQNALLKTLEEPPGGVTIVLCADDEDRLLPTVRSRCARVRLGPLAIREVEALLAELDVADAPTAARTARLSAGRPGLAIAYARAPDAVRLRAEIGAGLLDLLGTRPAGRLAAVRELIAAATAAVGALDAAQAPPVRVESVARARRPRGTRAVARAGGAAAANSASAAGQEAEPGSAAADDTAPGEAPGRAPASERRRAVAFVLEIWADLARDLAIASLGERRAIRDVGLMEELGVAAGRLGPGAAADFLARLARASEGLEVNVSPELAMDVLVLAWPTTDAAA